MARKKTETGTESSKETKAKGKLTRPKICMKTTKKKLQESWKHNSRREEKKESPFSQEIQRSVNTKDGEPQEVPVLDLHSEKRVRISKKMKLQLFPLDSHTLKGLEKDGFHPYLELTLSSRKKVSSVLQHINTKWGSSEIARGDPTLYPYDKSVFPSGYKWAIDSHITINDVYAAIGAPSIFRLRYGWSLEIYSKTDEPPSPSTPGITCFTNEEPQNTTSNKTESAGFTGKGMFVSDNAFSIASSSNQVTDLHPSESRPPNEQVKSTENKLSNGSGPSYFSWDDGLTSLSIGGLLSEVSMKGNFGNQSKNSNATLWVDNLTNISIGGLFSEASLQDRCEQQPARNNNEEDKPSVSIGGDLLSEASSLGEGRFSDINKTWETRKRAISKQPLPLISDSLDAFLVNQTDQRQAPSPSPALPPPPPEMSHSSILDAEDTCHEFSFRKRTTTSQNVLEQVSEEAEEELKRDESKPAKGLFGSMDSSLGFSGIKWADSRGAFDFGLASSSRKFTSGDSVSFGVAVKDLQEKEPLEVERKL
ncbi:unnamed protein product [Cochlearia groenlandica]